MKWEIPLRREQSMMATQGEIMIEKHSSQPDRYLEALKHQTGLVRAKMTVFSKLHGIN